MATRSLLLIAAAGVGAGILTVSGVAAGPKPNAIATSSGKGAAVTVVSGSVGRPSRWRIVVTTKPAHLPVLVEFGSKKRTGKSPMIFKRTCARCSVSATGQLWLAGGRTLPAGGRLVTGSISIAIYRTSL
jgi:hypothetical protein